MLVQVQPGFQYYLVPVAIGQAGAVSEVGPTGPPRPLFGPYPESKECRDVRLVVEWYTRWF